MTFSKFTATKKVVNIFSLQICFKWPSQIHQVVVPNVRKLVTLVWQDLSVLLNKGKIHKKVSIVSCSKVVTMHPKLGTSIIQICEFTIFHAAFLSQSEVAMTMHPKLGASITQICEFTRFHAAFLFNLRLP